MHNIQAPMKTGKFCDNRKVKISTGTPVVDGLFGFKLISSSKIVARWVSTCCWRLLIRDQAIGDQKLSGM